MGGSGKKVFREVVSEPAGSGQVLAAAGDEVRGHKLTLPDGVFERLVLTAIKRGSTASAILDRQLPRHRIVTDD